MPLFVLLGSIFRFGWPPLLAQSPSPVAKILSDTMIQDIPPPRSKSLLPQAIPYPERKLPMMQRSISTRQESTHHSCKSPMEPVFLFPSHVQDVGSIRLTRAIWSTSSKSRRNLLEASISSAQFVSAHGKEPVSGSHMSLWRWLGEASLIHTDTTGWRHPSLYMKERKRRRKSIRIYKCPRSRFSNCLSKMNEIKMQCTSSAHYANSSLATPEDDKPCTPPYRMMLMISLVCWQLSGTAITERLTNWAIRIQIKLTISLQLRNATYMISRWTKAFEVDQPMDNETCKKCFKAETLQKGKLNSSQIIPIIDISNVEVASRFRTHLRRSGPAKSLVEA